MVLERGGMSIRRWTRHANAEPRVRVGIILDRDAFDTVQLRLPAQPYTMTGAVGVSPGRSPLKAHTTLVVRYADNALAIRIGEEPETTVKLLRFSCRVAQPLAPGSGVLVRDVPAGRGFHWQKRIDQTLAGAIDLLPGRRGVVLVNELPLEDYLAGVVTAEMSGACPADLLKAQCVVARSWLLAMAEAKHDADPFDRCNDDCCQRYQGTADLSPTALDAVRPTRGLVLLDPGDEVLDANYAKSCGGISETPDAVWGVDKPSLTPVVDAPPDADEQRFFPITEENLDEYLDGDWLAEARMYCSPQVVPAEAIARYLGRVDQVGDYFRWTVHYERRDLEQLLVEKLPQARGEGRVRHRLAELRDLRVITRGVSGRANALEIEWEDSSGQVTCLRLESEFRIREVLHRSFLYSSAFAVRGQRDADGRLSAVTLRGAGWGHGVGLCQIGALGMALSGIDFKAICRHYYPAARLDAVYD